MKIIFANARTEKFYDSIDRLLLPEVIKCFELLEIHGRNLEFPISRALGYGLFELRIVDVLHIRFIYTFEKGSAYILHGFFKKSEQITHKDMKYARKQAKLLRQYHI